MNFTSQTAPGLAHCSDASAGEFSAESIFGMFLTVGLCILTQPYGSLFYPPAALDSDILVREAWQEGNGPTLSRAFPFYHSDLNGSGWREQMHVPYMLQRCCCCRRTATAANTAP
jgi:hypothetical protein